LIGCCKSAALSTTRTASGVARCAIFKLASLAITAIGIHSRPRITIFPCFNNAITTHLQRDGLSGLIRIKKAGSVYPTTCSASHNRAWHSSLRTEWEEWGSGHSQMFPTVHGEKIFSLDWETGFIMKRPSAEQTPELKGQQGGLEEQLPLH
jgi:hypothetical protein